MGNTVDVAVAVDVVVVVVVVLLLDEEVVGVEVFVVGSWHHCAAASHLVFLILPQVVEHTTDLTDVRNLVF